MLGFPKCNTNDFATLNSSLVFSLQFEHFLRRFCISSILFLPCSHACSMVMSSAYANTCMFLGVSLSNCFNRSFTQTLNNPVPIDEPCLEPDVISFSFDNFPSTLTLYLLPLHHESIHSSAFPSAPHYKCRLLLPAVDRKIDVSRYLVNKVKTSTAMTKFQSSLNFDEIFDLSFQEEVFRIKI